MKILVIGDPHGKLPKSMDSLINKNDIELIICVGELPPVKRGDSGGFIKRGDTREMVRKINSLKKTILLLRGNSYTSLKGSKFFNKIISKYKRIINKEGLVKGGEHKFILFEMFYEREFYNFLSKEFLDHVTKNNAVREKKLNKLLKENKDAILISHVPPYGFLDITNNKFTRNKDKHVGSKVLLKAIRKYPPGFVFCGHIHEAKGISKIRKTIIINAGSEGDYFIFDTETNKVLKSNFLK